MSNLNENKIAEKVGNAVADDVKLVLKNMIPQWLEILLKPWQRILADMEGRMDRIEQSTRSTDKDIESLKLSYQKLEEDFSEYKIKYQSLPNKDNLKQTESNLKDKMDAKHDKLEERMEKAVQKASGTKPNLIKRILRKK